MKNLKPQNPSSATGSPLGFKRLLLAGTFAASTTLPAVVVDLLPSAIHNDDTTTASFTNGEITLTPTRGGVSEGITFNANPVRLGIDEFGGQGENAEAFSEADNIFGNGNEEGLNLDFNETSGLSEIAFHFSSFGGENPTDGVQISGFQADPQAFLSGFGAGAAGNTVTFEDGVLTVIFTNAFGAAETTLNFPNPAASGGSNLVLTIGDSLPSVAQLAVLRISYENEIIPDADGDGILDDDEAAVNGDPSLFDTDGDGYSDGFEVDAGTLVDDPSSSSAPPASGRESIGVSFTSAFGDAPNRFLSPLATVGAPGFVQTNWNSTSSLPAFGTYTEQNIATPNADTLTDSLGLPTAVTFSSTVITAEPTDLMIANQSFSANNDRAQPVGGLLSGYVFADANNRNITIDVDNIPYPRYDVVVYGITNTGSVTETGRLAVFDPDSDPSLPLAGDFTLTAAALTGAGEAQNFVQTFDRSSFSTDRDAASENFPRANYAVVRGLTSSSASLQVTFETGNFGIAAFQIVNAPDTDLDGLGDAYEVANGLNPADNGSIDSEREGASGDFDGDGLTNLMESVNETDPGESDSDGDGLSDLVETDTAIFVDMNDRGTDARIVDTDGDGLDDMAESGTGVFVSLADTGTNPVNSGEDSDGDTFPDAFEILQPEEDNFDAFDPDLPGGPNPNGFAIAFNAMDGEGTSEAITFPGTVYAGAPGVEQRNWNRTSPQGNRVSGPGPEALMTFGTDVIESPVAGQLTDSSGVNLSGGPSNLSFSYSPGSGIFSLANTGIISEGAFNFVGPFGRLFNSYAFGSTNTAAASRESRVTFSNIPYSNYDAYVYFGAFTPNNGTVSNFDESGAAIETFSFVTVRNALAASQFIQTEETTGNPPANYAVFENQTSSSFDVRTSFPSNLVGTNIGIFGVQIVESFPEILLAIEDPARVGAAFSATFTASASGNYQLQRSLDLSGDLSATGDGFSNVGEVFSVTADVPVTVTDPASPATRAFYRVIEAEDDI